MALRAIVLLALVALAAPAHAIPQQAGLPPDVAASELVEDVVDALEARRWLTLDAAVEPAALHRGLVSFQEAQSLAPTGWIDPDTLARLGMEGRAITADVDIRTEEGDVVLPGSPAFHLHEATRLSRWVAVLRDQARTAGTESARSQLLAQAEKASLVAQLHRTAVEGPVAVAEPPAYGAGVTPEAPPPPGVDELSIGRDEILAAQQALQLRGLLAESPSGVFTAETRAAISLYQRQQGRVATGHLDARTLEELVGVNEDGLPIPRAP